MSGIELPVGTGFFYANNCIASTSAVSGSVRTVENWYYNRAIQMYCNKITDETTDLNLCVSNTLFWNVPLFDEISYDIFFLKDCAFSAISDLLSEGYYVYFCDFAVPVFGNAICESGVIVGYDKEALCYIVMTTVNNVFKKYNIKMDVFQNAVNLTAPDSHAMFHCFRISNYSRYTIDFGQICKEIEGYLSSTGQSNAQAYGLNVYGQLAKYIEIRSDKNQKINLNYFKILLEHKNLMGKRMCLFEQYSNEYDLLSETYRAVVTMCYKLLSLMDSYNSNKSIKVDKAIEKVLKCRETEKTVLASFKENIIKHQEVFK